MPSKTLTKKKPIDRDTKGFVFDKEAHAYTLEGKPLFGVTTILRVINKPALINWSANMACDETQKYITLALEDKIPTDTIVGNLLSHVIPSSRKAHQRKKETAGEAGTDAHEMIEVIVKNAIELSGGLVTIEESGLNNQVDTFIRWAKENQIKFLESELRLYSATSWYAGTCDLVFLDKEGKKWIGDVKTGSAIYPEYYFQMAAYQNALQEMGLHSDIKGAMVINTKKNGGLEIGVNFDYEGNLRAFLAALTLHKQLSVLSK